MFVLVKLIPDDHLLRKAENTKATTLKRVVEDVAGIRHLVGEKMILKKLLIQTHII